MHLWIWMLQMHKANSLTTVLHTSRTNVQHAIIVVKKVILHMIVILKHKIIIFQDLYSPSINHNHHCITNIRRQDDHKVLVAHLGPHWGHNNNLGISDHWHEPSPPHHLIPPPQYTCICLQQGPCGDNLHFHHILDQKTDYGNPCD